jgi:TonB family protein
MILLAENAITVALILLLALTVMAAMRRRAAALRHWVLATALVCAAAAPAAKLAVPSWHLPLGLTSPAPLVVPTTEALDAHAPISASQRAAPVAAVVSSATGGPSLMTIWLAGVGIGAFVLLIGLTRLATLASSATRIENSLWARCAADISREYGVRDPLLLQSGHPSLLVTWGVRQPKILLPACARAWREDRIRLVLAHELAHARRRDWLITLGSEVLRAVYWFNPVLWIVCRRLRQESEQACDDAVLNRGVEGAEYAEHLVDIARELQQSRMWLPAPSIARTSTLERRVKAMLDSEVNRRPLSRLACAATLLALLSASIPLTGIAVAQVFGTVTGSIVDPTNGALPGVTLVLTNTQTQAKHEVKSDASGRYEFVGLVPGEYLLEAKLPGFAVLRGSLTVTGQSVQQDLKLEVGSLQETITLTASRSNPGSLTAPANLRAPLKPRAAPTCGSRQEGTPVGGNIRPPHKLLDVRPVYPAGAIQNGVEGTVTLEARIGTDGSVEEVKVVSTPNADLGSAAADAVRQWLFDPTYLNCVAIPVKMAVTVNFQLEA